MKFAKAERLLHRRVAASCYNRTWDYLEMKKRTREDDRQMLELAHTSRYHWGIVGTARNRAVGDWQISRVYIELNEPDLALLYAKSALGICKKNNLAEVAHVMNEGMARAYAKAGMRSKAIDHIRLAKRQLAALSLNPEDSEVTQDRSKTPNASCIEQRPILG